MSTVDDILGQTDKVGGFNINEELHVSEEEEPQGIVIDFMKPKSEQVAVP